MPDHTIHTHTYKAVDIISVRKYKAAIRYTVLILQEQAWSTQNIIRDGTDRTGTTRHVHDAGVRSRRG